MKQYNEVFELIENGDYSTDYIGAYSTKEKAEKSIQRDIVRRFDYVPDRSRDCYRHNYDIIEDEVV